MRYSLMPSTRTTPHYGVLLLVLLILFVVAPLLPAERAVVRRRAAMARRRSTLGVMYRDTLTRQSFLRQR